jgi:hypothetical protein
MATSDAGFDKRPVHIAADRPNAVDSEGQREQAQADLATWANSSHFASPEAP